MLKSIGLIFLGLFTFCSTVEEAEIATEVENQSIIEQTSKATEEITLDSSSVEMIKGIDELDIPPVVINDPNAKELTWATLADVEYNEVYLDELDAFVWEPVFGDKVKAYKGEQIYITGYMVPVDIDANYFVLSRYPFAQCFFCGNAGPESVVDLRLADEDRQFIQDERLTFTGKLRLNSTDIYELNYILEDAKENK